MTVTIYETLAGGVLSDAPPRRGPGEVRRNGNPERVKGNAAAAELQLSDSAREAVEGLVPLGPAFG